MSLPQFLHRAPRSRAEQRQVDSPSHHAAARERELLRRIHEHGDTRARDQLAEEMLPLARALAGRYANRGEPLDDLVQVACIGIMKAIDGFDLTRDVRFSSYATPTVLGEIKRHFRDKTWAMRVPRGLQELQLRVAKARDKLTHELGRSPTVQEIATAVEAPFEEVLATIQSVSARRTRSLDEPTGEDVTLADSLGSSTPRSNAPRCARCSTVPSTCSPSATRTSCACASTTTSHRPRSLSASASARCRSRD